MKVSTAGERAFIVCLHDATPAFARETETIIRVLSELLGRTFSFGVVPDWDGRWPLASHSDYCHMLLESGEQLLLHGHRHRRAHGSGVVSLLAERSDEMNGLGVNATRRTIGEAHAAFAEAFGRRAEGFVSPAWQRGNVCPGATYGIHHVLGFFSLDTKERSIPLATWSWDCGRWSWLGHAGHGMGRMTWAVRGGIPSLAVHPRDVARGHLPRIRRVICTLLDTGYQPSTPARLADSR